MLSVFYSFSQCQTYYIMMMLGSKGILTPLIPNCYVLCTPAILKTFVIRSFFFKKWRLTHVFGGSQGYKSSGKQACTGFMTFWPWYHHNVLSESFCTWFCEKIFCQLCPNFWGVRGAYVDKIRVRLAENRPQRQVHERLREYIFMFSRNLSVPDSLYTSFWSYP